MTLFLLPHWIIELGSRRIIHMAVPCHPTDFWLAQQLREATPFGQTPCYLIHDRGSNYGVTFAHTAASSGIAILKSPYRALKANAICERFMGSLRRECLDHILILSSSHLRRALLNMWHTSIEHDRIKALGNAYLNLKRPQ